MAELRIDEVCSSVVDCEHKTVPKDVHGSSWAVGTPAMNDGQIDFSRAKRISDETYDLWTRRAIPVEGDLILAREAPVGLVVLVPASPRVALGQRTVLLRPRPDVIDSRYLHFLLMSSEMQHRMHSKSEGSTVRHLNVEDVRALPLPPLPPLVEQRAIAGVLGAIDDKIETNRRLARVSQDLARAEYESAIRDNPQRLPIADLLVPVNDRNPAIPRSTPYVGLEHFYGFDLALWNFGVAEDSKSATKVAQSGDLLFGRIRPYFGNVAVVGREAVVAQSVEVLRAKNPEFREVAYLGLSSREFIEIATTLSHGTTMPQVKWNELSRLKLLVPTDENILALHKRLLPLFELITSLPREFEYLTCLRDALLPELLSGRLRVKDAESMMENA